MFHRETDAEEGRAQSRRGVRPARRGAGVAGGLHRHSLSVRQVRLRLDSVVSVQRHGAPGRDLLQRSSMLLDESATENQMLGRASLISHETSHMWFGDLVTMRWFNDVWMKEVFANFMAAKIVNPSFPKVNHELRFLMAHYPAAYAVDRTRARMPSGRSSTT